MTIHPTHLLLDTNVVSEMRKGEQANGHFQRWMSHARDQEAYLSVLVVGELWRGIEGRRRRDPRAGDSLERWVINLLRQFEDRILPVSEAIAKCWGSLSAPDRLPVVDGLLAATAIVHDLVLVTRNTQDVARTGVRLLNPFESIGTGEP
jgi:toxin FitB